ncbi:MAG: phosphatidate cytidylyltransferase [Candidatus Omnitrophota bacterium]
MMNKRLISSFILGILVFFTICFNWFAAIFIAIIVIRGLYEFFSMIERKGVYIYKYLGITIGALIPLSVYFRFEITKTWELLFFGISILTLIILQLKREDHNQAIIGISSTIFGIFYIAWFLSFFIKIKFLPFGTFHALAVIFITKSSDIGAYLIGSRFGKKPLIPKISPKKTVEGMVGGLLFSVIAALIFKLSLPFSFLHLLFIGLFLGLLGQLGDLFESLIKRDCNVKDSGSIFPGLGGILDIIDSLLFTIPAYYFYISIIYNNPII